MPHRTHVSFGWVCTEICIQSMEYGHHPAALSPQDDGRNQHGKDMVHHRRLAGMGRELVEQTLRRGDSVAATLRRPEQLDDLAQRYGDRLWRRALDVTDAAAVRAVVHEAFAALGRIDVIVSNAGYGVFAAAEDLTDIQIDQMIETNLSGSIHLARAVLPHLRAQSGGLLMQMSSMGGHITFPGFALYHVTKWGIEGFYDALASEVEPFGIHTTSSNPASSAPGSSTRPSKCGRVRPIEAGPPIGRCRHRRRCR